LEDLKKNWLDSFMLLLAFLTHAIRYFGRVLGEAVLFLVVLHFRVLSLTVGLMAAYLVGMCVLAFSLGLAFAPGTAESAVLQWFFNTMDSAAPSLGICVFWILLASWTVNRRSEILRLVAFVALLVFCSAAEPTMRPMSSFTVRPEFTPRPFVTPLPAVGSSMWSWVLVYAVVILLLLTLVFIGLHIRWVDRLWYARTIGCFFNDGHVVGYVFPTLTGSMGLYSWRYLGKVEDEFRFHLRGPGLDTVVNGLNLPTVLQWADRLLQRVSCQDDPSCPLIRIYTFHRPYFSLHRSADLPGVFESEAAAGLFHPTDDTVELMWLGAATSTRIPAASYRSACERYKLATTKSYGVVSVALQSVTRDETVVAIAMSLVRCEFDGATGSLPDVNFMPLYAGMCPEDAKPMGIRPVSNVVYSIEGFGVGAPTNSKESERDTIDRRLNKPRSMYTGDPEMWKYANEFIDYLAGGAHLMPADHDRVCKQMDRPSQKANRLSVDTVMDFLPARAKALFMKREAVQIGKAGRNICTVSPQRLYRAARFMLPLSDWMQRLPWWVWGVGSGATSRKYQNACSKHPRMMESDFSKFDASLSPFFAEFNRKLMFVLFPDHHDEITDLLDDAEWQPAMTALGQLFAYGIGRMSGVNETAAFNTVDQAFVQFVAYRRADYDFKQSIRFLEAGLLGGDDGLVPHVGQDLPATAELLGMKVTYRVFDSESPCRFLGRWYLFGSQSTDSVQDIMDFVSNLHIVSCAGNISTPQALVNYATGLYVTDSKTPLIKEFCESVFRAYPNLSRAIHRNDEWWFKTYDLDDPFTLNDFADTDLIFGLFAGLMGIDISGLYALRDWFASNKFYVGSQLPVLEIEFKPKLHCAFQIYGIPFGIPDTPPELPRLTSKYVAKIKAEAKAAKEKAEFPLQGAEEDAALMGIAVGGERDTISETGSLKPLFGADDCFRCGLSGHKVASCPMKLSCRKCGSSGHLAKKCTAAEEQEHYSVS